jgi:hypothetical protein
MRAKIMKITYRDSGDGMVLIGFTDERGEHEIALSTIETADLRNGRINLLAIDNVDLLIIYSFVLCPRDIPIPHLSARLFQLLTDCTSDPLGSSGYDGRFARKIVRD